MLSGLTFLLPLIVTTQAYIPFSLPFFSTQIPFLTPEPGPKPHRIAIIGAGAAGSSAAYWIARAQNRTPENAIEVEVFEKEGRVGGRSTVVLPYNSKEYHPVELGASIFVEANKNLVRATHEFNLSFAKYGGEDGEFGIWDGSEFRFRAMMTNGGFSWWDTARLLWRYGLNAPKRSLELTQFMINSYLAVYNISTPDWMDCADIAAFLNFTDITSRTAKDYLVSRGVDIKYITEMVESMTRVNYAQNVDDIHALEGMVSQAANGASSIAGGNYQLFEQFLLRSAAKVHLNTTVQSLSKINSKWVLTTTSGITPLPFDSVILAAPYHSSGITVSPPLRTPIPPQPYINLHVTLLSTPSPYPNPIYFNQKNGTTVPIIVLTTNDGYMRGGKKAEFNSLTYHGKARLREGANDTAFIQGEHIVKIFSETRIEDEWLESVFGKVGWLHRKEWNAYPVLPPTTSFPPVIPDENFYYVNSFEPFISTMETETVSSVNIVRLLLRNVFGANATSCELSGTHSEDKEVMKGWDC